LLGTPGPDDGCDPQRCRSPRRKQRCQHSARDPEPSRRRERHGPHLERGRGREAHDIERGRRGDPGEQHPPERDPDRNARSGAREPEQRPLGHEHGADPARPHPDRLQDPELPAPACERGREAVERHQGHLEKREETDRLEEQLERANRALQVRLALHRRLDVQPRRQRGGDCRRHPRAIGPRRQHDVDPAHQTGSGEQALRGLKVHDRQALADRARDAARLDEAAHGEPRLTVGRLELDPVADDDAAAPRERTRQHHRAGQRGSEIGGQHVGSRALVDLEMAHVRDLHPMDREQLAAPVRQEGRTGDDRHRQRDPGDTRDVERRSLGKLPSRASRHDLQRRAPTGRVEHLLERGEDAAVGDVEGAQQRDPGREGEHGEHVACAADRNEPQRQAKPGNGAEHCGLPCRWGRQWDPGLCGDDTRAWPSSSRREGAGAASRARPHDPPERHTARRTWRIAALRVFGNVIAAD
jgi:hypothetical protein